MKKSNWIVYIVALVISASLLWLWFFLGFDHVDAPLDLVLSIIWWVLVALACFGIHRVEKKRRERLRTCYLTKSLLYNSEAGTRSLSSSEPDDMVETMRDVLSNLDYGFDIQARPEDANGRQLPFAYVIRSKTFKIDKDSENQRRSDESIEWEGEVVVTARPNNDPIPFDSPQKLREILRNVA